jgi:hypothetical protein
MTPTSTPPDHILLQIQQLDEMRESPGWREQMRPALDARIAEIERALCAVSEGELDAEETRAARRERQALVWMRDTPERLLRSFQENYRRAVKATKRTN